MKQEVRKQLESLYAWADFYAQNNQWASYEKCQRQIEEFKIKHNIY